MGTINKNRISILKGSMEYQARRGSEVSTCSNDNYGLKYVFMRKKKFPARVIRGGLTSSPTPPAC